MLDEQFWWYLTRASAVIAWSLLVISVFWGILLSTRILKPRDNPSWLLDLHRWLSSLSIIFVGLHMFSLYMDSFARFSISDLLIPFHSKYTKVASLGGWPMAIGVICTYVLLLVQGTSLMMRRLPRKYWKAIHYSSYFLVLIVSFHAGWSGTDVRSFAYRVVAIALIGLTTLALILRILFPKPARTLAAQVEGRRANQNVENKKTLVVTEIANPAVGIKEITFQNRDGSALGEWVPGSHITLHLPNDLKRQYSLCGDLRDKDSYTISVLQAPQSRGGSQWIHQELEKGMSLEVSGPHNHFEIEPAKDYLFIAGGIGITPIKAMIESLPSKKAWTLVYAGRSRSSMAYANDLEHMYQDRVTIHSDEDEGHRVDLDEILNDYDGHVYTCGPEPLLAALMEKVPAERLHFERFNAVERSSDSALDEFTVILKRSGKRFSVSKDQSLLEAINQNGGSLISSCGEGVCGTCEVRFLGGYPQHLDSVMSDEDKDEIGVMYPCVSRSKTAELILDI